MKQIEFFESLNNESNHRILLWPALKMTTGDVVEFGSGHGSTPFLKKYCEDEGRSFKSFENHPDWSKKTGSNLISDWNKLPLMNVDVLFIDHAPGEQRKFDIIKNAHCAKIIVVHDSEKAADHGYQMRQHIKLFKYAVEINTLGGGAGAMMLSNHIDLIDLVGQSNNGFTITKCD